MVRAAIEYRTPFRPQVIWAAIIFAHFFTFGMCAVLGFLSGSKVTVFMF